MTNRTRCLTQMGHKRLQKQQHDVGAQEMYRHVSYFAGGAELLQNRKSSSRMSKTPIQRHRVQIVTLTTRTSICSAHSALHAMTLI